MPTAIEPGQAQRLKAANESLDVAERELETALHALAVSERADKQMISDGLRSAFEKLTAAKAYVAAVLRDAGAGK